MGPDGGIPAPDSAGRPLKSLVDDMGNPYDAAMTWIYALCARRGTHEDRARGRVRHVAGRRAGASLVGTAWWCRD